MQKFSNYNSSINNNVLNMEGEEIFHEVGGKEFTVIPCLNDRDDWTHVMATWINEWAMVEPAKAIA